MVGIIPAAGLGTRMHAVTGGAPKELLPLGSRTVLERVIDEARAAGCDEVVVVSSPLKPDLDIAARNLGAQVVHQNEMRGLAHAVACAGVTDDALVLLGDTVFFSERRTPNTNPSIIDRHSSLQESLAAVLVESIPPESRHLYGIVERPGFIVEKPKSSESPWAVCARYYFSAEAMAKLPAFVEGWSGPGEVGLTPFLNLLADFNVVPLPEGVSRVDCGSVEEYRAALKLPWD